MRAVMTVTGKDIIGILAEVSGKCSELNVSEIDRRVSIFSSGLSTCEPDVDDPQAQSESTINTVNRKAKFLLMVAPLISDDLIVS